MMAVNEYPMSVMPDLIRHPVTFGLIEDLLRVSKLNVHKSENLPLPLFAKEGDKTSLWQREVRRDFINNVVPIMRLLEPISKSKYYHITTTDRHSRGGGNPCFSRY
jgi:hypothetical protein